ncbi:hypothetical protein [Actinomyces howellii]|uniref:SDR-like Ig domain-containing protein n=1 Tax=Actinomyces howellii TaxID=52771 RepID=A0A3S5EGV5_9ACTO|nr:hypothetical protein [Actinomyces howellii]VEG25714.1 Uncharacterised protein [Actinomyces howellii]
MHTHTPRPTALWRRTLALLLTTPLAALALAVPAQADTQPQPVPLDQISASGSYDSAPEACRGSADATDCLTWTVVVPDSLAAEDGKVTFTVEADSQPGQWSWACPSSSRVAGTATFWSPDNQTGAPTALASADLSDNAELRYGLYGDKVASIDTVECSPEHLTVTVKADFSYQTEGSYLELAIGTTVHAPGAGERAYDFAPEVIASTRTASVTPTATVRKKDAAAAQVGVATSRVEDAGAASGTGAFAIELRNESASALTDFTVSPAVTTGPATLTSLSCDLSPYGGQVVTDADPADGLSLDSGDASVPSGQTVSCRADLTGVVGRNTVTTSVTAGGETFTGTYVDDRPVTTTAVTAESPTTQVESMGTGADGSPRNYVAFTYTVTFTNTTDAAGRTSQVVLRPQVPAGLSLAGAWVEWQWQEGTFKPFSDFLTPGEDGSLRLPNETALFASSTHTVSVTAYYDIDVAAVTAAGGWDKLGACVAGDPTTGLSTDVDIASGPGIEATTHTTCTAVTRPEGQ